MKILVLSLKDEKKPQWQVVDAPEGASIQEIGDRSDLVAGGDVRAGARTYGEKELLADGDIILVHKQYQEVGKMGRYVLLFPAR
jgi:hypothetical protein